MKKWPALVCLLGILLAVFAGTIEARHRADRNRKADFDFFFLVRQWPATFCNDHSCTHRPPEKYVFTLHGMWPQRRDGTWPEFCDPSDHLRPEELDDIMDDLEKDWPSWSSSDEQFWDHEWSRHGTCAEPVTGDQHRFFQTVLALHHKLNIQDALKAAGIMPSNSRRYPVQDIKDAIENMYGVMPHVTCDGHGELSEVWMCINKKLRPIDCVEDPRPHGRRRLHAARDAAEGTPDDDAAAPAPPNYNCKMVTIPKLRRRVSDPPSLYTAPRSEAIDEPAASADQLAVSAATSIDAASEGDTADVAAAVSDVADTLAAVEQAAAAVALSVAEVVAGGAAPGADAAASAGAAAAGDAQGLTDTPAVAAGAAASPNQLLPLLACVVVAVVAASVVAAAVAVRAQSCGDDAVLRRREPPGKVLQAVGGLEAAPLLGQGPDQL